MIPIVLLAAGASARMAPDDKLLLPVAGEALLHRSARVALATGAPVVVVLPPDRPLRRQALAGLPVTLVEAADARDGMAASLRAGIAAVRRHWPQATAAMVLPADMPGLTTADLAGMLTQHRPPSIQRATAEDGTPGHPVIFPADLFGELLAITGDEGGRPVLARHRERLELVALPGQRATLDLDTPADWAAFRQAGG